MEKISLAAARVNARIGQKEAAEAMGLSSTTLRNYETGRTRIPANILKRAALLYNMDERAITVE